MIPNGVESHLFDVKDRGGRERGGPRIVAFAGNLAAHQGIEYLLRSFRAVRSRRDDVRLLIVSTSDFTPYERLATDLQIRNAIDLKRSLFSELPGQLARADVLVNLRTDATGLPMKLLNYMAAGRPIVSFEGSAAHLEDGKTAFIVKSGDEVALAAAILRLLEDDELATRLGAAARRQAREEFDWTIRAAQVEAVYERVVARHSATP